MSELSNTWLGEHLFVIAITTAFYHLAKPFILMFLIAAGAAFFDGWVK